MESSPFRKFLARRHRAYALAMIKKPEMIEGAEAFQRFRDATKAIIAVPHATIKRRIEEHRAESAKSPNRRGPKTKAKR